MKPENSKRELKIEAVEDLRKGKLYLQKEWMIAPNERARKLLASAVQGTIDVISRIEKELEDPTW